MACGRASSMSMRRTVLPCSRSVRQRSRIRAREKTALPAPMMAIVGVISFYRQQWSRPYRLRCMQFSNDAFNGSNRKDIQRNALLDLHLQETLDDDVKHLVRVLNVNRRSQVGPFGVITESHFKRR